MKRCYSQQRAWPRGADMQTPCAVWLSVDCGEQWLAPQHYPSAPLRAPSACQPWLVSVTSILICQSEAARNFCTMRARPPGWSSPRRLCTASFHEPCCAVLSLACADILEFRAHWAVLLCPSCKSTLYARALRKLISVKIEMRVGMAWPGAAGCLAGPQVSACLYLLDASKSC